MNDFDKALAAGDGTLHSALDYWQERALKAEAAIAQPMYDAPSNDVILTALQEYRCTGHVNEGGGGAHLIDMLTHGDTTSVGVNEIVALADFIWGAISDATPAQPSPSNTELECTRSHPHENMGALCKLRTVVARLENEKAAQPVQPEPELMHPLTINLVVRFARALSAKLADAETKYGYSDGWKDPHWMDECRTKLMEHIAKGDPRDVAAYCMFLWHHGATTTQPVQPADIPTLVTDDAASQYIRDTQRLEKLSRVHPAALVRALCRELLTQAQPVQPSNPIPEGWVLAPSEPSDEMLNSGKREVHGNNGARDKAKRMYRAMLTAAPVAQPVPENIAAAERERIARHFDERDKGIGFYDPHEPAEIIRALDVTSAQPVQPTPNHLTSLLETTQGTKS